MLAQPCCKHCSQALFQNGIGTACTVSQGRARGQSQKDFGGLGGERIPGERLWLLVTWEVPGVTHTPVAEGTEDKSLCRNNCPNPARGCLPGQRVQSTSSKDFSPQNPSSNCSQCINCMHIEASPDCEVKWISTGTLWLWLQTEFGLNSSPLCNSSSYGRTISSI